MKRVWIGIALLSCAWAFGITFYHGPIYALFFLAVGAGLFFISKLDFSLPSRPFSVIGIPLSLPVIFILPWPYTIIPIFLLTGLLIHLAAGLLPRDPKTCSPEIAPFLSLILPHAARIAKTLIFASALLAVQAVALELYVTFTASFRELPRIIADLLNGLATMLGFESGVTTAGISLFTMRKIHTLGATWELILDPVLLAFIAGSIFYFCFHLVAWRREKETSGEIVFVVRKFGVFVIGICIWIPLRSMIMLALFLNRALLVEYEEVLNLMNQFFSQWVFIGLLIFPLLFAVYCVRLRPMPETGNNNGILRSLLTIRTGGPLLATICSVILICTGIFYDPSGLRNDGRVLIDEYHTDWEPTERSFDTEWYGEKSTYNYACIYDYTSHYYNIARLEERITATALADCDVLILKVPEEKYGAEEIKEITDFVRNGGGLILIAEHTDVFRTSSHLNTVALQFGFEFEDTSLIDIDNEFRQTFHVPRIPHPIIQHILSLRFQVSCSIKQNTPDGRAVIRAAGLRSLFADYHMGNFYPQVVDHSDVRYGAFIQLLAKRYGKGRVAAFTDSTVFSNFSAFEPGISELWLGMIEWCNRRNPCGEIRGVLFIAGSLLLGIAIYLLLRFRFREWVLLFASILFFWGVCSTAIGSIHGFTVKFPEKQRDYVQVTIDRNICNTTLGNGGFIEMSDDGFGIFELWVLRLGYFTKRCYAGDVFDGDLAVFFYPDEKVSAQFAGDCARYVNNGGKVLILDSSRNTDSTANRLLEPFGMKVNREETVEGMLEDGEGEETSVSVSALTIEGGTPFGTVSGRPVASWKRHGKGHVGVIGFGNLFNDDMMGNFYDIVPDDGLMRKYRLQFSLIRSVIQENRPLVR
ncbi:MAG: hypothetical protein JW881_09500 [Spirochaetales bacterium]|nr:hypothetical protein [Spirochaetales bacterium]